MDEKVGDRVNALNSARYRTRQKQARLHDLQMQYKQLSDGQDDGDAGGGGVDAGKHGDDGKGDAAKSGDGKEDEDGQVMNAVFDEKLTFNIFYQYFLSISLRYCTSNFSSQSFSSGWWRSTLVERQSLANFPCPALDLQLMGDH